MMKSLGPDVVRPPSQDCKIARFNHCLSHDGGRQGRRETGRPARGRSTTAVPRAVGFAFEAAVSKRAVGFAFEAAVSKSPADAARAAPEIS